MSSNHDSLDAYEVVYKSKIEKAKDKRKTKGWKGSWIGRDRGKETQTK